MILLDTHIALWVLATPDRLGGQARAAIAGSPRVWYSSISIAEITIKRLIGRIDVPADLADQLDAAGLVALPLTARHAEALDRFPQLARHDPFDRLLLAQAAVERCAFVTADAVLLGAGFASDLVVDARI